MKLKLLKGGDIGGTVVSANGVQSDVSKANSNYGESGGLSQKIEREEGELSRIGDSQDNFVVYEDHSVNATAKPKHSVEPEREIEDADERDGDEASEAGEDASPFLNF